MKGTNYFYTFYVKSVETISASQLSFPYGIACSISSGDTGTKSSSITGSSTVV